MTSRERRTAVAEYELDSLDEAIIGTLQRNGRASHARIGRQVGLSADAVRVRMTRLARDGVLRIIGLIDPGSLGLRALATIGVEFHGPLPELTDFLRARREVTFHVVTIGEHDVIIAVACLNNSALADFAYGVLASYEGVRRVEIWSHLQVIKWETSFRRPFHTGQLISGASDGVPLDSMELQLLRRLVNDPRSRFTDLAAEMRLPYSVVRRRCQDLFDRGVVQPAVVVNRVSTEAVTMAFLGLSLTGPVTATLDRIAALPQVELLLRSAGRFQALAEVAAKSRDDLADLVDRHIYPLPGVTSVSIYLYARIGVLPYQWVLSSRAANFPDGGPD
jgi:DNA-binding Lrp family transcriptional regulator